MRMQGRQHGGLPDRFPQRRHCPANLLERVYRRAPPRRGRPHPHPRNPVWDRPAVRDAGKPGPPVRRSSFLAGMGPWISCRLRTPPSRANPDPGRRRHDPSRVKQWSVLGEGVGRTVELSALIIGTEIAVYGEQAQSANNEHLQPSWLATISLM